MNLGDYERIVIIGEDGQMAPGNIDVLCYNVTVFRPM
jgi:hypothetical protein